MCIYRVLRGLNGGKTSVKHCRIPPLPEDEPVGKTAAPARPTPGKVAALMEVAIATALAEGIAVPPDLARRTLAVTRKLAALARRRDPG
jgi:hypothetical protein